MKNIIKNLKEKGYLELAKKVENLKVTKEDQKKAFKLGQEAFHKGMKRGVRLDKKFMKMLEGLKVGEGAAELMKKWYKGWDTENIKSWKIPED